MAYESLVNRKWGNSPYPLADMRDISGLFEIVSQTQDK